MQKSLNQVNVFYDLRFAGFIDFLVYIGEMCVNFPPEIVVFQINAFTATGSLRNGFLFPEAAIDELIAGLLLVYIYFVRNSQKLRTFKTKLLEARN